LQGLRRRLRKPVRIGGAVGHPFAPILPGPAAYGQRPGLGSWDSLACQSWRTGEKTSTISAPSAPTTTECGTCARIRQVAPGPSSRVSAPIVNVTEPSRRRPTCSFACACSGTTAPASSSSRLRETRSPWTVRPTIPSQICCGPSEATSAKTLTESSRYRLNAVRETRQNGPRAPRRPSGCYCPGPDCAGSGGPSLPLAEVDARDHPARHNEDAASAAWRRRRRLHDHVAPQQHGCGSRQAREGGLRGAVQARQGADHEQDPTRAADADAIAELERGDAR